MKLSAYGSNEGKPCRCADALKPRDGHPLLIEVADTSIQSDRDIKIPLYNKSGISEVWSVNLKDQAIEIHQEPGVKGCRRTLRPDDHKVISPILFSDSRLNIKQFLLPS